MIIIHDDGKFPCFNMEDVKRNYNLLLLHKELWGKFHYKDNETVKGLKRSIRIYFKNQSRKPETRVFDADYDGATYLIELPAEIKTKEIADAWIEANEYCECIPSQYDCTGQTFTAWYKLVKRNGRWWCYHRVCFDV